MEFSDLALFVDGGPLKKPNGPQDCFYQFVVF